MWCPSCGEAVPEGDLDCPSCGAELETATTEAQRDRLGEDAARVGRVLEVLSWFALAVGALVAVGTLVAGIKGSGLSALVVPMLTVVYTATLWAFTMLGAVVARYVVLAPQRGPTRAVAAHAT